MNKVEIKKTVKKIKEYMWCQLLYLIPGAILCSKFNYSDVTSVKPRLHKSFSFSFSSRKSLKMVNMQSKCVLTHQIWTSLPLYAHVRFLQDSTPPPTCVRTLWMAPLQQNNLIFSVITIHLGYNQKLSWKYCNYYHLPYIKISIFYQKYGHLAQKFCSLSS